MAEAVALADSDPMHRQEVKTYQVPSTLAPAPFLHDPAHADGQIHQWHLHESSVLGVGVRAWLNGNSPEHVAYWPDQIDAHAQLPSRGDGGQA